MKEQAPKLHQPKPGMEAFSKRLQQMARDETNLHRILVGLFGVTPVKDRPKVTETQELSYFEAPWLKHD